MSLIFLKIKRNSLAAEARIIRRKELKFKKKWITRSEYGDFHGGCPESNNYLSGKREDGWDVKVRPIGHPNMTEDQRTEYRQKQWGYIAKMRKLNRSYNIGLGLQLMEHRIKVVRPEARATNLAIAYLQGKKYDRVETQSKDIGKRFQKKPDLDKVWRMVCKYGPFEDSPANKECLEAWLWKGADAQKL
jgi:hypothetical protein